MHTGCVAAAGNSTRKKGHPPTPEPQTQTAFCKMQIRTCLRPRRDVSPSVRPWTRYHRVFQSRSRGETAAPPPQPAPAGEGMGMGTGIACLPLTQESLQRPKTKNTTKQMNKKKIPKPNNKKQNTVITS